MRFPLLPEKGNPKTCKAHAQGNRPESAYCVTFKATKFGSGRHPARAPAREMASQWTDGRLGAKRSRYPPGSVCAHMTSAVTTPAIARTRPTSSHIPVPERMWRPELKEGTATSMAEVCSGVL